MKKFLFLLLVYLNAVAVFAQKSGNTWSFGAGCGMDFNTNPIAYAGLGGYTNEGVSSISRASNGEFLFSSDGRTVITRDGNYAPKTLITALGGDESSTQSALIVPFPNDTNKFYIFTAPSVETMRAGTKVKLTYSIFDLTLNNGFGDISAFNIPLLDSSNEKLCAVGNCDGSIFWVLSHRFHSNEFYAYKITSAGIAPPVITAIGTPHKALGLGPDTITGANIGYMKFSSDAKHVGLCIYNPVNTIEILDFNFGTGILSNPIKDTFITNPAFDFAGSHGPYGCSFSPDGSKFYVSLFKSGFNTSPLNLINYIYQYDLSNKNTNAIIASKKIVASYIPTSVNDGFAALQNGPDGKMYIALSNTGQMPFINQPNLLGLACGYSTGAGANNTQFPSATSSCLFGLPNIVESFLTPPKENIILPNAFTFCQGDSARINLSTTGAFTFQPNTNVVISNDGYTIIFYPTSSTTYTVFSQSLCGALDTNIIQIKVNNTPTAAYTFEPNGPVFANTSVTLSNTSTNATTYQWFANNSTIGNELNQIIQPTTLGNYCVTLVAKNAGCVDTFINCIDVKELPIDNTRLEEIFIYNTFTPNDDQLNDTFKPWVYFPNAKSLKVRIYNRYGTLIYETSELTDSGWNGQIKERPCDVGTYFYSMTVVTETDKKISFKGDINLLR